MPRFHFHVLDGTGIIDSEGSEMLDVRSAKAEALKMAGEILREKQPADMSTVKMMQLVVNDGPQPSRGHTIFSVLIAVINDTPGQET